MLICPDCGSTLWPTAIFTAPGGKIQIDHCPRCRGTWFDHWEINRLPKEEAEKIFRLSPQKVRDFFSGSKVCPHCGLPLTPQKTESIPPDLPVFVCPQCQGNWVSQKTLFKLKTFQAEKITSLKLAKIPLKSIYSVLLPLLILGFSLAIPLTVNQVRKNQEQRIRAKELIGQPQVITLDSASVLIFWSTSRPLTSKIEFSTPGVAKTTLSVSPTPQISHQITLTGLKPQSHYSYRLLVSDQKGQVTASPTYIFKTP